MLIGVQQKLGLGPLVGERTSFPYRASSFSLATGITPTSLYLCNETSGNLIDVVSGNNLAVVGTPNFATSVGGSGGIQYFDNVAGHAANVNDMGLNSFILGGVAVAVNDTFAGLPAVIGRASSSTRPCVVIYRASNTVNYPTVLIRDAVNTVAINDPTVNIVEPRRQVLYLIQVNRYASTATFFVADTNKVLINSTASISSIGTLSGGSSPVFFTGGSGAFKSGMGLSLGFYAVGAQCEGSNKLNRISVGLGFKG